LLLELREDSRDSRSPLDFFPGSSTLQVQLGLSASCVNLEEAQQGIADRVHTGHLGKNSSGLGPLLPGLERRQGRPGKEGLEGSQGPKCVPRGAHLSHELPTELTEAEHLSRLVQQLAPERLCEGWQPCHHLAHPA
jgi:hypothetical protein